MLFFCFLLRHKKMTLWWLLFVCDAYMHIFIAWIQKSKSPELSHPHAYPIVSWFEMKQILHQPGQTRCPATFTIKYPPTIKRIEQSLIKWNTQAMPLSHDAGAPQQKKHQLQMVTNADYNPGRSRIQCISEEWSLLKFSRQIRMNRECLPFKCWLKWIWNCFSDECRAVYSKTLQTEAVHI